MTHFYEGNTSQKTTHVAKFSAFNGVCPEDTKSQTYAHNDQNSGNKVKQLLATNKKNVLKMNSRSATEKIWYSTLEEKQIYF